MGRAFRARQQLLSELPLRFVTDFFDGAVICPVAAAVAVVLAAGRWRRGFASWSLIVGSVMLLMLMLKIVGLLFADDTGGRVFSPSGHVASACIVYGGGMMMFLNRRLPISLLSLLPLSIAVLAGVTRIMLGAHDLAEVVVGGLVGSAGAVGLILLAGPPPRQLALPTLAAALAMALVFHGTHAPFENMIRSMFVRA